MVNGAQNRRNRRESGTQPLGRREPASGIAIVLVILDVMGLSLAAFERIGSQLISSSLGGVLMTGAIGGLKLVCLLVALLLLLLWADLTSTRGLLESEKLRVSRIADWVLLCAAVFVGVGISGVIQKALVEWALSPFLGF